MPSGAGAPAPWWGSETLFWGVMRGRLDLEGSIPLKYSVSNVVGCIKGKSAIQIACQFGGRQRNFGGENFWVRGCFVFMVGLDEAMVRSYICHQEQEGKFTSK